MPDRFDGLIKDLLNDLERKFKDIYRRVAQLEMADGQDVVSSVSYSGSHDDLDDVSPDDHHDPVTLDSVEIQAVLDLNTQALDLDTQTSRYTFMAPVAGGKPAFRAITEDDISDLGAYLTSVGEGPGIDITGVDTVGLGGDTILLYDSGGDPVSEFAATDAGLTSALAAMAVGDTLTLPSVTITGGPWTVAYGTVIGTSREGSVLDGQVTLSDGTALENLTIERSENDAGAVYGLVGPPAGGVAYAKNVTISITNAGAGTGIGVYLTGRGDFGTGDGDPGLEDCTFNGCDQDVS